MSATTRRKPSDSSLSSRLSGRVCWSLRSPPRVLTQDSDSCSKIRAKFRFGAGPFSRPWEPLQSLDEHKGAPRVSRRTIQPFRYVGFADRVTPRHLGCHRPYPPTLGNYWPDTLVQQYLAVGREYRHDHHYIPHGLIQSTQNRDSIALHLKLDELIRATSGARNGLLEVDGLPVVHQRHPPQGGLPGIHNPARGGRRRIWTSLIHPAAWKGCSPRLVCTIVHTSPCGGA